MHKEQLFLSRIPRVDCQSNQTPGHNMKQHQKSQRARSWLLSVDKIRLSGEDKAHARTFSESLTINNYTLSELFYGFQAVVFQHTIQSKIHIYTII